VKPVAVAVVLPKVGVRAEPAVAVMLNVAVAMPVEFVAVIV
jgi:hypothetical protein